MRCSWAKHPLSRTFIKQVHNDAAEEIADIEARERALAAREEACNARKKAHAVSVAQFVDFVGKASVLFDRIQQARADQEREPIALPPDNQHKLPDLSLEVEGDAIPGKAPGNPPITDGDFLRLKHSVSTDQAEFPQGELPAPPVIQQPIAD
jgi:hypothetical protein